MVQYFIEQENFIYVFEIKYIKNSEEIYIRCKITENFSYSSLLKLDNLKDINNIFKGCPKLIDAYKLILDYFNENRVFIENVNYSKMIVGFNEGDIQSNLILELKRNNSYEGKQNNINNHDNNNKQFINNIEINNINNNIIIENYCGNKNIYNDNYINRNEINIYNDYKLVGDSLNNKSNNNYNIIYNTNSANNNIINNYFSIKLLKKIHVENVEK